MGLKTENVKVKNEFKSQRNELFNSLTVYIWLS